MEIRPEILQFACNMEEKLREYDSIEGKRGWDNISYHRLLNRLKVKALDLEEALNGSGKDFVDLAIKECVDVANFALMIYNKLREEI